ncbi:MAG: hypothetical protein H5T69_10785 [Chloroflexi bacterium]|nr:hypothetical protein [Chloroflexota bacterium]
MPQAAFCVSQHPDTHWTLYHLSATGETPDERTIASFVPETGCNLMSFKVGTVDYLYGLEGGEIGPRLLGTPILYPTPNRVRNAEFTFEGRIFRFQPNNGPHFIHGLVRDVPWQVDEPKVSEGSISVSARITFEPGRAWYDRFPIRNSLELTFLLRPRAIRLVFVVRNEDLESRLPFGLAIHPYFPIIGPRESVRIQVPAQKWMEADHLIPTGRLLDLAKGPVDLTHPTCLQTLDLDDVFWGAEPEHPQVIYYDQIGKKVTLRASAFFTHCVVYTPQGRPYFCIENQSCSTDAHNLYARGLQEAAHLAILEPGQSLEASVEIEVSEQ